MTPRTLKRGIELLDEREGDGAPAVKGDSVVFNLRVFLHRRDEVPLNEAQAEAAPLLPTREVDGKQLIDRRIRLGRREAIAGVERTLMGMKPGGYRKVRVSPHLAYREAGVPGLVPENALLLVEIWLQENGGGGR